MCIRDSCLAGHKSLMGPQGIGALLVGPGVELRPLRVGGTGVQSASKRLSLIPI